MIPRGSPLLNTSPPSVRRRQHTLVSWPAPPSTPRPSISAPPPPPRSSHGSEPPISETRARDPRDVLLDALLEAEASEVVEIDVDDEGEVVTLIAEEDLAWEDVEHVEHVAHVAHVARAPEPKRLPVLAFEDEGADSDETHCLDLFSLVDSARGTDDGDDDEFAIELVRPRPSLAPPPPPPLLDGLEELASAKTSWRAAAIAAKALKRALGARAVIVHSVDERNDALRVIAVEGPHASSLLGGIVPAADDFVASALVTNRRSIKMSLEGGLPRIAPSRLAVIGAKEAILAVPILRNKHTCVGMIEVVDPDDTRTIEGIEQACRAPSERLGKLL